MFLDPLLRPCPVRGPFTLVRLPVTSTWARGRPFLPYRQDAEADVAQSRRADGRAIQRPQAHQMRSPCAFPGSSHLQAQTAKTQGNGGVNGESRRGFLEEVPVGLALQK